MVVLLLCAWLAVTPAITAASAASMAPHIGSVADGDGECQGCDALADEGACALACLNQTVVGVIAVRDPAVCLMKGIREIGRRVRLAGVAPDVEPAPPKAPSLH